MRHFHKSSSYATGFSQAGRQRSLPEIRQLARTNENVSCSTISRRALNLPLDKGSSRLLKQSAQNFFYQESFEKHEEDLDLLKQDIDMVGELCDQVCSGHVTSKDKLAMIEQHISSAGKLAANLWSRLKRTSPLEDVENNLPCNNITPDALIKFCEMVERLNSIVCNYCSSLAYQGLITRYKWSEPDEVTASNPYMRAEELMTVTQSREYQVKFCHANITHRTVSATQYVSAYSKENTALAGSTPSILDVSSSTESSEKLCSKLTKKCTMIHRLIIVIGAVIAVLLLIAVVLIAALKGK